ncbi:hypothetical protein [Porcincola intestinalis]|jgi:Na+/H+ antiporter NhaA|nr:hypothetical protein [Porcincola intestinalis]
MVRYEIYHKALKFGNRILEDIALLFCGIGFSLALFLLRIHWKHFKD